MLVVLMAIIDLSRTKIHAATRWLWLVLSGGLFVAAPLGCDELGQPAYGAPADIPALDVNEDPGLQPEYGPPGDIYIMETVYGPPLDYHEGDEGQITDIQILYGPPADYIVPDEGQATDYGMDNIQPLYGAVDIIDDARPADVDQPMYGPVMDISESDVSDDIQILYGPPAK